MKKEYKTLFMTVTKMEVSPLLTLSRLSSDSNNPEVIPNSDDLYEGEFSSREYDDFDEEEF